MNPVKVLVVENDPAWQELLKTILVPPEFLLEVATSYGEAVNKIQSPYDLVITNLCLKHNSDYSGKSLLEKLAEQHTPSIVLTGAATSMRGLERYQVGDIFIKGRSSDENITFNEDVFLSGIKSVIAKSREAENEVLPEEYVDFELRVDRNNNLSAYSNEGERSAGAIPEDLMARLSDTLNLIEADVAEPELLRAFGKDLYRALFPQQIHLHLNQTESAARVEGRNVRIRLMLETPQLAAIPWEFLYREEAGHYLSINPRTVLSRYLHVSRPQNPRQNRSFDVPLRLLLIMAAPIDQAYFDPSEWEAKIREALDEPLHKRLLVLDVLSQATSDEISGYLLRKKPDLIQFVGHGQFKNGQGSLALLDSKTGNAVWLDDEQFSALLMDVEDRLRLICLTACDSAKTDSAQGLAGLAPKIVQRGIPAVICMQYRVKIYSAAVFLEHFYKALAAHKPVDWAVQAGRRAISIKKGFTENP